MYSLNNSLVGLAKYIILCKYYFISCNCLLLFCGDSGTKHCSEILGFRLDHGFRPHPSKIKLKMYMQCII